MKFSVLKRSDGFENIIARAHRELDAYRAHIGLKPWDWTKPKKTQNRRIYREGSLRSEAQQRRRAREKSEQEQKFKAKAAAG